MTLLTRGLLQIPVKSKVFVSYHHGLDQIWYDQFSLLFGTAYDVVTDRSLERRVDSDDTDYLKRAIRERNITGTSVTIVLCGAETWKRRWVDWEISMTLNKQHALLGIVLPTHLKNQAGEIIVPDRLLENVLSGYAHWIHWTIDPSQLSSAISTARELARQKVKIINQAPLMKRSHP